MNTPLKPLLDFWNEEAFQAIQDQFKGIEVQEVGSYKEKEYKRIHFILNENQYLCAALSIGYPFGNEEKPSIFTELKIYENDHWTSYFDGALLPAYLDKAKAIQREISGILAKIHKANEKEKYGEAFFRDFSHQAIERTESMTETERSSEIHLYNKYSNG